MCRDRHYLDHTHPHTARPAWRGYGWASLFSVLLWAAFGYLTWAAFLPFARALLTQ